MTGYRRRLIWYKLQVGRQHGLAVAQQFTGGVGFQQKLVLFGDFKNFKLENLPNLPKIPIICQNPSTLENDAPQPNRAADQLLTYTKSNVFYSLSFFILCTFDLHLSHLTDLLNILIII